LTYPEEKLFNQDAKIIYIMRHVVTAFILVFITWLLLSFNFTPDSILIGAVVSASIAYICRHLVSRDAPRVLLNPVKWAFFAGFVAVLTYQEILSHIDVCSRIMTGRIRPGLVRIPAGFRSDLGKALLGNSITLTPGTLTVKETQDSFIVHAIGYRKGLDPGKPFRKAGLRVIG
jgi:multicomponent Na+:H+ antiporter subunit E